MGGPEAAYPLAALLFDRYATAVRRYFRRHLSGAAGADDLAQEVFVRVVRGAAAYDERQRERAWVFRIARNVLLDHHRHANRAPESAALVEQVSPPVQAVALDVRRALATLSPEERDAFLLAEVGGLTYEEIADTTASTAAAVRSRIYRARLALREHLMPPGRLQMPAIQEYEDHE